ncbi:tyrosine-protein phosphatase [uncultured Croceicoccus sp.]|uniref:tyrosine-protein phosphatase n=1 Tax=uncultured Croceicoccus sp. TaxID=1295329 RepID=UPI00260F498A|nr:tyrosine-protein phosphatase [uncultured Croceicoccus sp.]
MSGGAHMLRDRRVPLEGARNFRDFGGYTGAGGRRVRRGMLYRANRLSKLTPGDIAMLDTLAIGTVFDLRARREREADVTVWTPPALQTHHFRPGHKRRLIDMAMDYPATREGAAALMHDFYAEMPFTMAHVFGEILARIADGAVPCVIHCSAGKDRTGMAAALILAALGVSRDDIVADYTLTALARQDVSDQARAVQGSGSRSAFYERFGAEAVAVLMDAHPDYIGAAFDAITEKHGSVEGYLDHLDVNENMRDRLRAALLIQGEDTP